MTDVVDKAVSPNQTYVVPDTNFLLHGRPLGDVSPAILGVDEAFTWLFVRTVVKELTEKTHLQNARMRRRAGAALRAIEAAELGESNGRPLKRYRPDPPLQYAEMGFDPYDGDEKILAEIIGFKRANPEARVLLLTLDTGMRLHAADHFVELVNSAEDLRVGDEEDPTEKELRNVQREIAAIRAAQPDVVVRFADGSTETEVAVYPPLSELHVSSIVDRLAAPEDQSPLVPTLLGAIWHEDSNYDERLAKYADKVREAVLALWNMGTVISLPLALVNDGDVEASDVRVDLVIPDVVKPLKRLPDETKIPPRPSRYIEKVAAWQLGLQIDHPGPLLAPRIFRDNTPITKSGPTIYGEGKVGYWEEEIRQRRTVPLTPLLLDLQNARTAFSIDYEVRGTNMTGVRSGRLLARLRAISSEEASDRVERALRPAPG
jgi:PIN domain